MTLRAVVPSRLARRWEQLALQQLTNLVVQQAERIEQLERQYLNAEGDANHWHEEAMRLQEELAELSGRQCGLTRGGHLVLVDPDAKPVAALPDTDSLRP